MIGTLQVPKKGMTSKQAFAGDFFLHVEFMSPFMPEARGQGRGNSGCYLPNGQEVQVLDSFGMETYTGGGCGGLYKYKDPDAFDVFSLASLPPGEWQTYDVEFRVVGGRGRLTVLHNGIKIPRQRRDEQAGPQRPVPLPGSQRPGPLPEHMDPAAQVARSGASFRKAASAVSTARWLSRDSSTPRAPR